MLQHAGKTFLSHFQRGRTSSMVRLSHQPKALDIIANDTKKENITIKTSCIDTPASRYLFSKRECRIVDSLFEGWGGKQRVSAARGSAVNSICYEGMSLSTLFLIYACPLGKVSGGEWSVFHLSHQVQSSRSKCPGGPLCTSTPDARIPPRCYG